MGKLRDTINEMKLMLNDSPKYTLESYISENFIMPEDYGEESHERNVQDRSQAYEPEQGTAEEAPAENKITGIEKELTEIRKIALNVITRLADQPSSEQYILMKKIWNTVDKAIENGSEKMENI